MFLVWKHLSWLGISLPCLLPTNCMACSPERRQLIIETLFKWWLLHVCAHSLFFFPFTFCWHIVYSGFWQITSAGTRSESQWIYHWALGHGFKQGLCRESIMTAICHRAQSYLLADSLRWPLLPHHWLVFKHCRFSCDLAQTPVPLCLCWGSPGRHCSRGKECRNQGTHEYIANQMPSLSPCLGLSTNDVKQYSLILFWLLYSWIITFLCLCLRKLLSPHC